MKDYNIEIDGKTFFDQPVKSDTRFTKSEQVKEMITQLVVCQTIMFKHYYKMIAIDLNKEKALDSEPKAIQQINFTGNLKNQLTIFSITKEAKETVLDFSQGTVKVF